MKAPMLHLDVLGYREDGEWVALALDLDIRGYGPTFDQALDDLKDLIRMQVSFAMQMEEPELIYKPAETKYHEIFRDLKAKTLRSMVSKKGEFGTDDFQIGDLPAPDLDSIPNDDNEFAVA